MNISIIRITHGVNATLNPSCFKISLISAEKCVDDVEASEQDAMGTASKEEATI